MENTIQDVSLALAEVAKGTASFEVRASLEGHLLGVLQKEGFEGIVALLSSLPGFSLSGSNRDSGEFEARFTIAGADSSSLVLEAFLSPDIASVDISPVGEPPLPVDLDPRHRAFYETWEGFLGLPETPVAELDPWQRAVFLIGLLESQVMNGGLGQYLTNTNGDFLEETLECLSRIGARKTSAILEQAGKIGGEAESYVAAWEVFSEALQLLDDQFLDSGEDLAGLTVDCFLDSDSSKG